MLKIGDEYKGGIIFNLDKSNKHGLIAAKQDLLGVFDWIKAKNSCKLLNLNGFTDWIIPNRSQLNQLYVNRGIIGGFNYDNFYWSLDEYDFRYSWYQAFSFGNQNYGKKDYEILVRAIRKF